ncbi:MAG TPA: hypothetical protein EYN67_01140 [Flavobacteriales bacterium]|nr:hypothetical protein [Methylococcaceae bacterium]HHZ94172.1 hypothetical protein [Flavobacteriales bacterium]
MAILNYANQLNASRQGALGGILQTAGQLQGLRANEQTMQRQRDKDSAQQQQAQNQAILSKEAQEVFARNDVNEIASFSVANPVLGKNILASKGIVDAAGQERVSNRFANILTSANPQQALEREIEQGEANGLDMTKSKEILAQGLSPEGIKRSAGMALASIDGQRFKDIQQSSSLDSGLSDQPSAVQETEWFNKQSPEIQETHLRIKRGEKPSLDEKLDYEKSKASIKEDSAISTARKKSSNERRQGYIDSGVSSADNLQAVNRSIELLDSIKTGGIDNALIRAKQTLGIESADEAELSYELGKSVLKQLKPTFGAAFTVNEMLELKKMESGLGKSVAGNRRILTNLGKMIKRSANRGMRAAESLNDTFAANEIRLAIEGGAAQPAQTQANDQSAGNAGVPELSDDDLLKKYGG